MVVWQQIRVGLLNCDRVLLMVDLMLFGLWLLMLCIMFQLQVLKCLGVLLVNQFLVLLLMEMWLLFQKQISLFRFQVLVSEVVLWDIFFIRQLLFRNIQVWWLMILCLGWLQCCVSSFLVSVKFIVLVRFWLSGLVVVFMLGVLWCFGWLVVLLLSWWNCLSCLIGRLQLFRCSSVYCSIELWLLDNMKWLWLNYLGLFGL